MHHQTLVAAKPGCTTGSTFLTADRAKLKTHHAFFLMHRPSYIIRWRDPVLGSCMRTAHQLWPALRKCALVLSCLLVPVP
jgi:hypothetical protein